MAYQALYRKWRPASFSDVVGQEHITETLKRQVSTGRTSHAYLFTGTRGTGKTTCAKILAKAVNCEHPVDGDPCGVCPSCVGIDNGSILDVEELDAASNNGVDHIRTLRDEARYTPAAVRKRVYIVDEVHMLSTAAFNALLKIMEEPPEHLIFVLATTELHKVPATILSRCQRYSFRRISSDDIARRLSYIASEEGFELTASAANLLARLGDGSMRDALSLLDQCCTGDTVDEARVYSAIGLAGSLKTVELFRHIAAGDSDAALQLIAQLYADGKDVASMLDELSLLYRDLLLMRIAPRGGSALLSGFYDDETLDELSRLLPQASLMSGLDTIMASAAELGQSMNPRLTAEMCALRLSDETLAGDIGALSARVAQLEQALENGEAPSPAKQPTAIKEKTPAPAPAKAPPADLPWDDAALAPAPKKEQTPPPRPEPVPAPASEPEPSPEPVPDAVPDAAPTGGFDWHGIVAATSGSVDALMRGFLEDKSICTAEYSDGSLNVCTKTEFACTMLNDPTIVEALERAAAGIMGSAVTVKILAPGEQSAPGGGAGTAARVPNMEKLNQLSRFGNVDIK